MATIVVVGALDTRGIEERAHRALVCPIFHAVGVGGQTMERLVEVGHAAGVLDVTLTEWADELGGVLTAGPHNANTFLLIRTNVEENAELGRIIAGKLNHSRGQVAVYLPLRGFSVISSPGGPYHWPEADAALISEVEFPKGYTSARV